MRRDVSPAEPRVPLAVMMPLIMLGVLQSSGLRAQAPVTEPVPSFEVASVRENKSGERTGPYFRFEGSQFVVVNNNLLTIIRTAWRLPPEQVLGGPDWVRSERERFDILAKAPDGSARPQMDQMVRALLAERFKLKTHPATRDVPMYALVMARPDRKRGPQLSESSVDCNSSRAAANRGERGELPPAMNGRPSCVLQSSPGSIRGGGVQIADFARVLSFLGFAGRPVIDRSDLTGEYDIELKWSPEPVSSHCRIVSLSTAASPSSVPLADAA
jgi:uncharacterized protein (TIGR03435 family)